MMISQICPEKYAPGEERFSLPIANELILAGLVGLVAISSGILSIWLYLTNLNTLENKLIKLEKSVRILHQSYTFLNNQITKVDPKKMAPDKPSRENLQDLKKVLKLNKGCLQHKMKGDGIYHVVYNRETKKSKWIHLDTWKELKKLI